MTHGVGIRFRRLIRLELKGAEDIYTLEVKYWLSAQGPGRYPMPEENGRALTSKGSA